MSPQWTNLTENKLKVFDIWVFLDNAFLDFFTVMLRGQINI